MTEANSNTNNTQQINISSILQGTGGSTTSYIEQIITLKVINVVEKLFKKFDKKSLAILILLLCANEGKQLLFQLLTSSKEKIIDILNNFDYSRYNYLLFGQYENLDTGLIELPDSENKLVLDFQPNLLFWKNIFRIIQQERGILTHQQTIHYNLRTLGMETKSKNEYKLLQELTNIIIKTPMFTCSLNGTFEMELNCINGIHQLEKVKGVSSECNLKQGQTFFDVFPFPEFKKEVSEKIKHLPHPLIMTSIHQPWNLNKRVGINNIFGVLFKYFDNIYKFSDKIKSFYELRAIMELCNSYTIRYIFGHDISKIIHDTTFFQITFLENYTIPKEVSSGISTWIDSKINGNVEEPCSVVLESSNEKTELLNEWVGYLQSINCVEYNEKEKVNVYDIHIKVESIKEEPQKQEQMKENKETETPAEKPDINTVLLMNIINQQTKETNEPKTKIVKSIVCNQINKVYKSFDTLYLQKNDQFVLQSTLSRFKDKKELFETLGIPYKLGILLHGLPGCGKSSVITAVASYLQRDIFYVDLSNVSTNEDLKSLFKHINTQQNKNGIIVMEDIDTMCEIVLKRSETYNGASSDGKLTLDCLLNLLQGTLMEDGLIFIATTNHLEKLDPAFYRDGRFDVNINMKPCDEYQMQTIYNKFFKRDIPKDYLEKLQEQVITPSTFIHRLLPYVLVEKDDSEMLQVFL